MLNNISFQANFIKPVIIQKKDTKDNWHPFKVSMVELDKTSVEDRKVLYEISKSWGTYNYVSDIYNEVLDEFLSEKIDPTKHVFAITTQKADYDNLRRDDVMCIAKFNEGKKLNELEYIQVNPEHGYVNYDSAYKKIGSTMLKFLSTNIFILLPKMVILHHLLIYFYCDFRGSPETYLNNPQIFFLLHQIHLLLILL